jgi:signal peptidase I
MATRTRGAMREVVGAVAVAAALALVLRSYVVEPFVVNGFSMLNSLHNQERVLVNKFQPRFAPLHYGEVVVFQPPLANAGDYIKRVIALGGQKVSMRDGQVYVDGRKMPQPFLHHGKVSTRDSYTMRALTVPRGDIFVLGDHRDDSEDSRYFGPVPLSAVQGVAFWAIWPLSQFGPIAQ